MDFCVGDELGGWLVWMFWGSEGEEMVLVDGGKYGGASAWSLGCVENVRHRYRASANFGIISATCLEIILMVECLEVRSSFDP